MIELIIYLCAATLIVITPVVLTLLQLVILMMESTREPDLSACVLAQADSIVRCDLSAPACVRSAGRCDHAQADGGGQA